MSDSDNITLPDVRIADEMSLGFSEAAELE